MKKARNSDCCSSKHGGDFVPRRPLYWALSAGIVLSIAGFSCGGDSDSEVELNCSSMGTASEVEGRCACKDGYVGDLCDRCASGWKNMSDADVCLPDCGMHGMNTPDWVSGSDGAACQCDDGYAGAFCRDCASGWQDNDADGVCLPTCALSSLTCEPDAVCDDSSGSAECVPPPPVPPAPTAADWTYMVFLNGDNDLGHNEIDYSSYGYPIVVTTNYALDDLQEMADGIIAAQAHGELQGKVNIIVLFDDSKTAPDPSTRVYRITAESGIELVDSGTEIFSGNEADMSSAETLKKFGVWAVKNYPARHYILDLWDHGGYWKDGSGERTSKHCSGTMRLLPGSDAQKTAEPSFRFSTDETDGVTPAGSITQINFTDGAFGRAMDAIISQAGKPLDIIAFDACAMAQFEIAAQVAPYADYLVASEDTVSGLGFSYDEVMKALFLEATTITPEEIGIIVADSYVERTEYSSGMKIHPNATMAVLDLSAVSKVSAALDSLGTALAEAIDDEDHKALVTAALEASWRNAVDEMPDMQSFLLQLKAAAQDGGLPEKVKMACDALLTAVSSFIIHDAIQSDIFYWNYSHDGSYGVSFFFPKSADCQYYLNTEYAYIYSEPYLSLYGDDYIFTMSPCLMYPDVPPKTGSGFFSLRDVKDYIQFSDKWGKGWGDFLKKYLGM